MDTPAMPPASPPPPPGREGVDIQPSRQGELWLLAVPPKRAAIMAGIAVFLISAVSLGVLYWLGRAALKESVREQLRVLALGAARQVNVALQEQLTDPGQMGTDAYRQAIAPLVQYHKLFPKIKYLYTVRLTDGKQSFVLDTWSDPEIASRRSGELSPLGEAYESNSAVEDAETLAAMGRGETYASREVFTDEYGAFMSGSAPLYDAQGALVGYAGVDLTMTDYFAKLRPMDRALQAGLLAALALSMGAGASVGGLLRYRQRVQRDVNSYQSLLSRVLENLTDSILIVRVEPGPGGSAFTITQANHAAARLTGREPPEMPGLDLRAVLPGMTDENLFAACAQVARTGRPHQGDYQQAGPGADRWLRTVLLRVDDLLVLALSDITQSKRHEEELESARAAAEAADRAKSQFLANISHEVRTPLNAIVGMSHLLRESGLNDDQLDYLRAIQTSSDALLTVINDVLDFAKIEAGRMDIEITPFDVREIVARLRAVFAPLAHQKGLAFQIEIDPTLPRVVRSDPARLRQILMNLLANALKFTIEGAVSLRVLPAGGGRWLLFQVVDTGIGVPPEQRKRIFEPFTQGDASTTRRYGGTGLGLAIGARLADRLGGRIELESQVARGSTFTLWLPVKQ